MSGEVSRKELLIDSIMSRGVADIRTCVDLMNTGYMYFSGNQWNEDWSWHRDALEELSEEVLEKVRDNPAVLLEDK